MKLIIVVQLEAVDDELDEIGILLVSTPDEEVAQEHGQDISSIDVKLDGFGVIGEIGENGDLSKC